MVAGRSTAWKLIKKLGEGDAGEVYLVESLLEGRIAILKRPHRSTFQGEVTRQASQIDTEGKILRALENVSLESRAGHVRAPALLDSSKPGTEFSERFFIVIEKAEGFDLNSLAREVTMGVPDNKPDEASEGEIGDSLFQQLVARGEVPRLLLLRVLALMLAYILEVHKRLLNDNGLMHHGAIWNDIKPDHLFWNSANNTLILIDWGNGKFLQPDGTTKDRQFSTLDDARQFIQEMGRFLTNFRPDLHQELGWPADPTGGEAHQAKLEGLYENLELLGSQALDALGQRRSEERELIGSAQLHNPQQLPKLEELQDEILSSGELPDYEGLEAVVLGLSTSLASRGNLAEFEKVCELAARLPITGARKWQLLGRLSQVGQEAYAEIGGAVTQALVAGLVDDWPAAIWELAVALQKQNQPAWWSEVSESMRRLHYEIDADLLPPYQALSRVLYILQSNTGKLEDQGSGRELQANDPIKLYQQLIDVLRSEILPKWCLVEPDPPDAGLEYRDIERILVDLGSLIPNARLAVIKTLDQPSAQVRILLEAWDRKEFDQVRKGLRRVLLWDPHRWRVLSAERAILATPAWLEAVLRGPQPGEPLADFMARLELQGRELRNRVGPARWLDMILATLQRIRKGGRASELVASTPEIGAEMPWVTRVGWVQPNIAPKTSAIQLEREPADIQTASTIQGLEETRISQEQGFVLGEPLDTWAPEARGSSARVFQGFLKNGNGHLKQAAIKIMRRDRADYSLPLFQEEIEILQMMADVPGVTGILECGYIKLDRGVQLPPESTPVSGRDLRGEVQRYGMDQVEAFQEELSAKIAKGWLPYLALEKRNSDENLMLLCDAGYTRGRFLPLAEGLRMSIQICDILDEAHRRFIVYRDHKILHYYWQDLFNGVFLIDWNVAKHHPQGLSDEEKQFDLVQLGARTLHHIFTGRTAPGALPMGPTRPEEIEAAAHSYKVQWTYDDQRLPFEMKDLLERVLAGDYSEVADLRNDLLHAFQQVQGTSANNVPGTPAPDD